MSVSSRDIPWHCPLAEKISPEAEARLTRAWAYRMWNEASAANAFIRLEDECRRAGAPEALLSELAISAEDEHRHADACRRLAFRFSRKEDIAMPAPLIEMSRHPYASIEESALYNIVLLSCISETIGAAFQHEIAERSQDPVVRIAQETFFSEELRHGRFGWGYLAFEAKRAPERVAQLELVLPKLVHLYAIGLPEPKTPRGQCESLERFGILGPEDTQAVFLQALHALVLPGFEEFGFDVSSIRAKHPLTETAPLYAFR